MFLEWLGAGEVCWDCSGVQYCYWDYSVGMPRTIKDSDTMHAGTPGSSPFLSDKTAIPKAATPFPDGCLDSS